MRMRTHTSLVALAAALGLAATQPAQAESRGYVVSLFVPAMNNNDDSDCPEGKNPIAPEILARVLKDQGKSQAEIDKIMGPGVFNNRVFTEYATMRGRIDGKPVNVYHNPLSVPDPHIKLAVTKQVFGFNLDGKEGPDEGVDPLTGEKGVNDAAARVFGCFDRTRGTLDSPPANQSVRWNYNSYGHSWLLEVVKPDGPLSFKNDDNVEVHIYRGVQPPAKNAGGYQRYMTYDVDPDPRLQSNVFRGKIRNGMFLADAPASFYMIASPRVQPYYDFKQARLRLSFKPDGSVEGFMGGFLPITMVYFPFGDYASGAEFNGGMDIPGVYYALRRVADTDLDADPKTGARTRISHTYLIRAVPAFLAQPEPNSTVAAEKRARGRPAAKPTRVAELPAAR